MVRALQYKMNQKVVDLLNTDPFSLFELELVFNINLSELKQKFLKLQQKYHPDNSSIKDFSLSSYINNCYQDLKSPSKRARLLLKQLGIKITDFNKLDNDFLQLQFELHEQISAAQNNLLLLENLESLLEQRLRDNIAKLEQTLMIKNYQAASLIINQVTFYEKFLYNLNNKLHQLLN